MKLPFKLTPTRIVIAVAAVVLVIWCIFTLIIMQQTQSDLQQKWEGIEAAYGQRFDLLPALEQQLNSVVLISDEPLVAVQEARSDWLTANTITEKIAAINEYEDSLENLVRSLDAYPQLTESVDYFALRQRFTDIAVNISDLQRQYNEEVQLYNVKLKVFPRNLLAFLLQMDPVGRFQFNAKTEL